jgi:hypothetical protein
MPVTSAAYSITGVERRRPNIALVSLQSSL